METSDLLQLQEELTLQARDELASMLGPTPADLKRFKQQYEKDVADYRCAVTRAQLIEQISRCDILYLGDYHTLRQSQKTLMRILKELRTKRDKIIVGLEMVHENQQHIVTRFVDGEIEESQLLEQIDYWEEWGFLWRNYRQIFQYGKKHNIQLIGLNLDIQSDHRNLLSRDQYAAEIISRTSLDNPGALVIVFYGDFHIAKRHIPRFVNRKLAEHGDKKRSLICYQNADQIYWRLLREQIVHTTDVVQIADDRYCVMSAPPWIKYYSYINWLNVPWESRSSFQKVTSTRKKSAATKGENLGDDLDEVEVEIDFDDQFLNLAQSIADFLKLSLTELDNFKLYTVFESNTTELFDRFKVSPEEAERLKNHLTTFGSVYLPKHNVFYFAELNINFLAEEAAHLIRYQFTRYEEEKRGAREQFYFGVMHAAFGFFGSKLVNYKRKCNKEDDFQSFLVKHRHLRRDPGLNDHRRAARMILAHLAQEQKFLLYRYKRVRLRSIFRLPSMVHNRVIKGLGYILGNKLYHALLDDEIEVQEIIDCFLTPYAAASPTRHEYFYLYLVRRLQDVNQGADSKTDRF